jgi:hypothetical protein
MMMTMTLIRCPGRLFQIELRRNATWAVLPVLAGLIWVASPYGRALKAPVVLWSSRSAAMQGTLQVLGPFAAAARHFAGLPEQVRRRWLAAHLPALRSGQTTQAGLP